ncbi:unnamed protein product [Linum tenue]|uniref:Uncharacterized protein n=1 Tax=Linum tenue TaxID=586396 RepID=A0AAV0RZW5_9ROSI|nr:unnamed protein product [Linum tenue]
MAPSFLTQAMRRLVA